jgi:hypothetical protein
LTKEEGTTMDFNNTLFITHGPVSTNIPVNDTSLYLFHNVDLDTLDDITVLPKNHMGLTSGKGIRREQIMGFQAYTKDCDRRDIKIKGKKYHYYSTPLDPCIYFPWATDLLPHEINKNIKNLETIQSKSKSEVHLVGSVTKPWHLLYQECVKRGIPFYQHGASFDIESEKNRSVEENVKLIQQSIVAPALESEWQVNVGYIPCRIFKNISYGKMGMTNSPTVNELFDGRLIYSENIGELLDMGIAFEKNPVKHLIVRELMEYVRDNHTYLNRIETILEFLDTNYDVRIEKPVNQGTKYIRDMKKTGLKLLHISFHKGCINEIKYVFTKLGHTIEEMRFDDGETKGNDIYKVTYSRAQKSWEKYKDYYDSFDGIITSDTCPTSRPFLQNNWSKLLIIWVCNRFDYAVEGDQSFYELLRSTVNRKNVYICDNTYVESVYSKQIRGVDITDWVIKPIGKNIVSKNLYKTYKEGEENVFYIPVYENETKYMNLSARLNEFGIQNKNERFNHVSELLEYKGIVCLPYAWSISTFFEVMQLGIIYFVPSVSFLIALSMTRQPDGIQGYWFQPPYNRDPQLMKAAEWYCDEHKELLIYFDSWEDLQEKIKTTDYEKQTKKILEYAKRHEETTLVKWNAILEDYQKSLTLSV